MMETQKIRELRQICQTRSFEHAVPDLFKLLRIFSIYLTYLFIKSKFTANSVSLIGIIISPISGIFLVMGYEIAALFGIFLSILCDFSDGEVARYWGETSKEGTFLDKVHHLLVPSCFFSAVIIWLHGIVPSQVVLIFGFMFVLGTVYFPIINQYAILVAVHIHTVRHIRIKNSFNFKVSDNNNTNTVGENRSHFIQKFNSLISQLIDFPTNILIVSVSILAEKFLKPEIPYFSSITFLIISAAAIINCSLCILTLCRVVYVKHVEKKLNLTLEQMLKANE